MVKDGWATVYDSKSAEYGDSGKSHFLALEKAAQ
jgi:hypothetical protein